MNECKPLFGGSTTSGAGAIPPPPDAAYLCNMAVAQAHRGRGVAKALMSACDELVREMGGRDIFLHVRVKVRRRQLQTRVQSF